MMLSYVVTCCHGLPHFVDAASGGFPQEGDADLFAKAPFVPTPSGSYYY